MPSGSHRTLPKKVASRGTISQALAGRFDGGPSDRKRSAAGLIAEAGGLKPQSLKPSHIINICRAWESLKAGTRIGYHCGLRHWLLYLGAPWSCTSAIPHVKSPDAPTRVVPDTEFECAVTLAEPSTALMLLLCREAGLRAATAYGITEANLDGELIRAQTKNEGSIVVPMTDRLRALAVAAAYKVSPGAPLVHLNVHHGANLGNTLRHRLAALQKREGLGDWTWHDLRRTAAQRLYERTGDLRVVQSMLGHKTILNTLQYLNAQRVTITPDLARLMASHGQQPAPSPLEKKACA